MNSGSLLTPSVFYYPCTLNTMADDASRRFDLPDNNFLSLFWSKYFPYHSAGSWTQCHPPAGITSCVIYVLRRNMSGPAMWSKPARISSTTTLENSAPCFRSSIGLMILPSQWHRSLRCTATRYVTDTGISSLRSALTWCLQRGELSQRSTFWMDALTPGNHATLPPETSTSASAVRSARTPYRTPPHLSS